MRPDAGSGPRFSAHAREVARHGAGGNSAAIRGSEIDHALRLRVSWAQ